MSKFSLKSDPRFRNTNFKPILIEVSRIWMELLRFCEEKLIVLLQETNNFDKINNFFMNNYCNKIGIFELTEMEELMWFPGSTFDTFSRRKLIEDRDTINELTARIRELQNEVNCMDGREILKMLNQYAVDYRTFPVNQRYFHLVVILAGCWAVLGECEAAIYLGYAWYSGKRFCKPTGVFIITLSRRIQSLDFYRNGRHITAGNEWTSKPRRSFGSEMPVRTVSQKFIRP